MTPEKVLRKDQTITENTLPADKIENEQEAANENTSI